MKVTLTPDPSPKLGEGKGLFHLQPFVGQHEFFHRDVGAFGVERPAGVLGDARAQQLPRLYDGGVILVL